MKTKCSRWVILLFAIFISTNGCLPANSKGSRPAVVHLFNGMDLSNFYTFLQGRGRNHDPNQVFTVQEGRIRISGQEYGCLTTHEAYENYRLIIEFKWGKITYPPRLERARDSGILLHSVGEDGAFKGIWMHSIEMQIIEGGTGDLLVIGDQSDNFSLTASVAPQKVQGYVFQVDGEPVTINSGRINWWGRDPAWQDVRGFRGKADVAKPLGQWNRYEGIVKGQCIDVYLNGVLVNRATNLKPSKGRIQIQSEGAELFVRRIDLLPLGP